MLSVEVFVNHITIDLNRCHSLICAALGPAVTHVHEHAFIRDHFVGVGEKSSIIRWMVSEFLFPFFFLLA